MGSLFQLRWLNTVSAHPLANVIQHAQMDYKNKQAVYTAITLFAQSPLCLLFFFIIEHSA